MHVSRLVYYTKIQKGLPFHLIEFSLISENNVIPFKRQVIIKYFSPFMYVGNLKE